MNTTAMIWWKNLSQSQQYEFSMKHLKYCCADNEKEITVVYRAEFRIKDCPDAD